MNSFSSRMLPFLLALLATPHALAASLQSLDVAALPGNRVELKLGFDAPVAQPRGYTIEQPARIALDLPGVNNQLGVKTRDISVGNARSLTLVEVKDRTRLIVNLSSLVPYATRAQGNQLFVVLGEGAQQVVGAEQPASPAPIPTPPPAPAAAPSAPAPVAPTVVRSAPPAPAPAQAPAAPVAVTSAAPAPAPLSTPRQSDRPWASNVSHGIRNIDFQRGEQGEGNVVIDLSDTSVSPNIEEQGGRIRLDFGSAELPDPLRVRLDVKDFATPVQFVSATAENGRTVISIEPTGYYDYLAYQTENRLTISVKPLAQNEVEQRRKERFAYSGEKLSLNFQDIEVRSVLQLIADFTNLNLVASDTVQGSITLRLQNVPWDQALDLVLKTKGLDKRQVGNVLLVAPADEIAARERQELESQKQIAELAPLRRELIQVNYAKAADIAKLFQSVTGADQGQAGMQQAPERGSITVDDRTNAIIAYQTQERLDELRRIVTQLDIPVRQVMIEARIVEANVDYDKSLGVRWGGALTSGRFAGWGGDGNIGINDEAGGRCGPFAGNCALPTSTTTGQGNTAENGSPTPFVDLGASNATSGIGIGFVSNHAILDLQLSAMESSGNGEIVSQPKVVTSDKETAKILTGSEVPYQEASSSGATSTSFKEAALSLEVTPQITPDNRVMMEVKINKDEPDYANALNGVPPINTSEVNAKVLVSDGETIVIGGVFSNTQTKAVDKVPFLGDLPFLGRLFRRDSVTDSKSELLVFLTPRIMNNQAIAVGR